MKNKYLLSVILIVVSYLSHAQVTTDPATGNVGISNANPQMKLDVNGGLLCSGNNLDNRNGALPLTFMQNSGKMLIGWNRSAGSGETDLFANQGPGGTGGFAFYNYPNTGTETLLMYMRGNGQLTIGDVNPYSYKLAVGGSMIAEAVTVKLQANWPDYVFKPNYQLKPLSEIKSYIDINHHLPDMPSAAEVEQDGLNLGDMNKLLTKKVEELTLYLIEKDKQIKKLSENQEGQNEINQKLQTELKKIQKQLSSKN